VDSAQEGEPIPPSAATELEDGAEEDISGGNLVDAVPRQEKPMTVDLKEPDETTGFHETVDTGIPVKEEGALGAGDIGEKTMVVHEEAGEAQEERGKGAVTAEVEQTPEEYPVYREEPEPEPQEPVKPAPRQPVEKVRKAEEVRRCDPGGPLGIRALCYADPGQVLAFPWMQVKRAMGRENPGRLQPAMNQLYEAKLDAGFPNTPVYTTLLIREAYRLLEKRDFDTARLFGETACDLSPDFYPAFDFMARLAKQDPEQGLKGFLYWKWVSWKKRAGHFTWQYRFLSRVYLVLLLSLYLFFLFLGIAFVLRYGKILSHAIKERVRGGLPGFFQLAGLLVLGFLVLILLPGFFWIPVLAGILFGRYAKRWEKALFLSFLLLWASSPWMIRQAAHLLSPMPDAVKALNGCTQENWNTASAQSLDKALVQYPESSHLMLAQALVQKRKGDYEEAVHVLERAVEKHPDKGVLWNNLGNLLAIRGDLPRARESYHLAIRKGNGTASSHYNLSQLLRRDFDFIEGSREFEKARRIDPERVDYFAYIHTQNANRFFMDESPDTGSLWAYLMGDDSEVSPMTEALWVLAGTGIPVGWTPWVFVPLAAVFVVLMIRRSGFEPFACSSCGVVICAKCQPGTRTAGICMPCYQSLYQKDQIVRERRNRQVRRMVLHQARRWRDLMAINLLFPGLGWSLLKERAMGMVLFFLFLFCTLMAIAWNRIFPSPWPIWETGQMNVAIGLGAVLLLAYLGIQVRFIQVLRAGR